MAKKLIVCKKCGAMNPDYVLQCGSCASELRSYSVKDSYAIQEGRAADSLDGSANRDRTDDRRTIWHTSHRNRFALNLFLMALFASILIINLLSGGSIFNIAVALVFLVLSTTRFILTLLSIRREYHGTSSIYAD